MTKKAKHPKLDPYLIAVKQKYEVSYVVTKLSKEGYTLNAADVKIAVKKVGHSRRKVYNYLRNNLPKKNAQ